MPARRRALAGAEVRTQVVKLAAQVLGVPADDIESRTAWPIAARTETASR